MFLYFTSTWIFRYSSLPFSLSHHSTRSKTTTTCAKTCHISYITLYRVSSYYLLHRNKTTAKNKKKKIEARGCHVYITPSLPDPHQIPQAATLPQALSNSPKSNQDETQAPIKIEITSSYDMNIGCSTTTRWRIPDERHRDNRSPYVTRHVAHIPHGRFLRFT